MTCSDDLSVAGFRGIPGGIPNVDAAAITGAPGTDASVVRTGTNANPLLTFTIPRGTPGVDGIDGLNGTGVVVDTVADLRAAAPNGTATTLGCNSVGDGGGGLWRWDATSSAADNTGTVVLPTGHVGAGRWVRQDVVVIYPEWFGAKGDGVTNDTVALQAALNTLGDVHGTAGKTYLVKRAAAPWSVAYNGGTVTRNHAQHCLLWTTGMRWTGNGSIIKLADNQAGDHRSVTFTASIGGDVMTVTAVTTTDERKLTLGAGITGSGITGAPLIVEQLTGTTGLSGTYRLSVNQGTLTSRTLTASYAGCSVFASPYPALQLGGYDANLPIEYQEDTHFDGIIDGNGANQAQSAVVKYSGSYTNTFYAQYINRSRFSIDMLNSVAQGFYGFGDDNWLKVSAKTCYGNGASINGNRWIVPEAYVEDARGPETSSAFGLVGNTFLCSASDVVVGTIVCINCDSGVKFQSAAKNITVDSIYLKGNPGGYGCICKFQGDYLDGIANVNVGQVMVEDGSSTGLYLYRCKNVHIGSYIGRNNRGLTQSFPNDIYILGSQQVTIDKVHSTWIAGSGYPVSVRALAQGAAMTGSIDGDVLTVTALSGGWLVKGAFVSGTDVLLDTAITEFLTGTGSTGTYRVSKSQTISSRALTASGSVPSSVSIGTATINLPLVKTDWSATTTYRKYDYVRGASASQVYRSKQNDNLNHDVTDTDWWESVTQDRSLPPVYVNGTTTPSSTIYNNQYAYPVPAVLNIEHLRIFPDSDNTYWQAPITYAVGLHQIRLGSVYVDVPFSQYASGADPSHPYRVNRPFIDQSSAVLSAYSAATTYAQNQLTTSGGVIYRSLKAGNLNNPLPVSGDTEWWQTTTLTSYAPNWGSTESGPISFAGSATYGVVKLANNATSTTVGPTNTVYPVGASSPAIGLGQLNQAAPILRLEPVGKYAGTGTAGYIRSNIFNETDFQAVAGAFNAGGGLTIYHPTTPATGEFLVRWTLLGYQSPGSGVWTYRAAGLRTLEGLATTSLQAIGNSVNTENKYAGRLVWDTTTKRVMRASGAEPNSTWEAVDGNATATITPA